MIRFSSTRKRTGKGSGRLRSWLGVNDRKRVWGWQEKEAMTGSGLVKAYWGEKKKRQREGGG